MRHSFFLPITAFFSLRSVAGVTFLVGDSVLKCPDSASARGLTAQVPVEGDMLCELNWLFTMDDGRASLNALMSSTFVAVLGFLLVSFGDKVEISSEIDDVDGFSSSYTSSALAFCLALSSLSLVKASIVLFYD